MEKIDYKKQLKQLYQPSSKEVVVVDVPQMNFLMVDGMGDPNTSQEYAEAVEVLFQVSYALKFMVKKGSLAIDYGVMPLEGLWWAEDMAAFTAGGGLLARTPPGPWAPSRASTQCRRNRP